MDRVEYNLGSNRASNRDLQIGLRVRDRVRVQLFNSSFQASHYHNTYPFHPMSHSLYLKPTWRTRALETSQVWNSKIVLVLNLILVVQSEGRYCFVDRCRLQFDYDTNLCIISWLVTKYRSKTTGFPELLYIFCVVSKLWKLYWKEWWL